MSLDKKLNRIESLGEDKKINLRMPKVKVDMLERLAKHYDTNVSTIIREMLDDALIQLQKELIVLNDEAGATVTNGKGKKEIIKYLPDVFELTLPEIHKNGYARKEFSSDEEFERFFVENERLSIKYGMSLSCSGITPITNKKFEITEEGEVNYECNN